MAACFISTGQCEMLILELLNALFIDIQKQDFYFSSFIIKLNTITKFSHDISVYDLFSFRMNFTEFT